MKTKIEERRPFSVRVRANHVTIIDKLSYSEAIEAVKRFEQEDGDDGIFEHDAYQIIQK